MLQLPADTVVAVNVSKQMFVQEQIQSAHSAYQCFISLINNEVSWVIEFAH